jgi:ABC-2 type transport system permease protein
MIIKLSHVLKLVWIERMAYRVNFLLEVISGMIASLSVALLWMAIYRSASQDLIGGYSIGEMVSYILGGGLLNTFILNTAENPETTQSIREGTLSGLLIQPISPYGIWFVRDLGIKLFYLTLGLAGYFIIFLFFKDYLVFPAECQLLVFFFISIFIGAALQFLLF